MASRKKHFRGTLAVETGGMLVANPAFVTEPRAKLAARADLYLRSLAAMGYVALNIGAHEMALPPKQLLKLARQRKLPLLSANIVYDKSGKLVFKPWILRKVGGLKVGVFGLVSESPPNYGELFIERGLRVTSTVAAARKAVAALKKEGAELILALSQLKRAEIDKLGAGVDGLNVILGSSDMQLSSQLARLEGAVFADSYIKGEYLGELLVHPGEDRSQYVVVDLPRTVAAERSMTAQQVRAMASEVEAADRPGSGLTLTENSKTLLRQRLAAARAKLQRLTIEMSKPQVAPKEAGGLELQMHALGRDIRPSTQILGWVKDFQKKFPKPVRALRR